MKQNVMVRRYGRVKLPGRGGGMGRETARGRRRRKRNKEEKEVKREQKEK